MKANELMIGDWVMYKNEPIMVWEIDKYYDRINTEPDGYNAITCVEISEITPIPLTAEILKENFTAIPNTFWSSVDYFYHNSSHTVKICRYIVDGTWKITYGEDTIGGKPEWRMYVTYIHELQHALRLCNIDKEIEL